MPGRRSTGLIERNDLEQTLRCCGCGELIELRRTDMVDPEAIFSRMEEMALEHKECEEWKNDPERCRRESEFKLSVRSELRKCEAKRRRTAVKM